jgi:hypothetical protein
VSRLFQFAKQNLRSLWVIVVALAVGYTWWQLKQIDEGHLFAFALPWDRPPIPAEIADAELSAQGYLIPAIVAVLVIGCATWAIFPRLRFPVSKPSRGWKLAAALFLIATLADLLTTLAFFHRSGVNLELHPGIRLFGYAYGLTIGPITGKLVQAFGILLLAFLVGRAGIVLLAVVTFVYGIAAIHNYHNM